VSVEWLVLFKFCAGASLILCISYHAVLSLSYISFMQKKTKQLELDDP